MRAFAQGLLLATLAASSLTAASSARAAEPVVLDRIVAVVNDDIILNSDLDKWMLYDEAIMFELSKMQNASEEQLARKFVELRPQALDNLIGRKLMLEQAGTFQITATAQEEEVYLQTLARNAKMSGIPELKRAVEESGRYGTWAQYKHKLHEDIILYKLENALLQVVVSDQQILDRYRELSKGEEAKMEVHRLVFRASEDPAERDRVFKQAKQIVRRLGAGEALEEVAAELGQSPEPETVSRSSVSRPIGERLFKAKAGDVVGPLRSGQGYVVFVVDDVIASDLLGFEEAKERLRQQIENEARAEAKADLIERLRGRAHVDIRL